MGEKNAHKNAAKWRGCVEIMKEVYLEVITYGKTTRDLRVAGSDKDAKKYQTQSYLSRSHGGYNLEIT